MAFGFPASYSLEIDTTHLAVDRARILAHETLGRLGWKIISAGDSEVISHRLKKSTKPSEIIRLRIEENSIEVKSKGVKWRLIDGGKNKENVENFELTFLDITQEFEGKDLIDFSKTYNQLGF